jgi:hypothetical protein
MSITVIRSGTAITGDGQTCWPDTDVITTRAHHAVGPISVCRSAVLSTSHTTVRTTLNYTLATSSPPPLQVRVRVRPPWWRCRESNPGPPSPRQGFSVRSPLSLYSDPPVTRTSQCDDPSRCRCPIQAPRPGLAVESPSRCRGPGRGRPRSDTVTPRLGGEGELSAMRIGAY